MSRHPSVALLSGYLDQELPGAAAATVEQHIETCETCRERLAGLGRVAAELRALGAEPAPNELGLLVARRLDLERRLAAPRRRRLASTLGRPLSAAWLPLVAVVLALAAIFYLLSLTAGREGTRVIVPGAAVESTAAERSVGGRTFVRAEGLWRELGLAAGEPERVLELGPEPADPELEPLRQLGGRVRLSYRGEIVELRFRDDGGD